MKNNPKAIHEGTKRCIIYTAMLVAGADGYVSPFSFPCFMKNSSLLFLPPLLSSPQAHIAF
jgi:hypothetical protein